MRRIARRGRDLVTVGIAVGCIRCGGGDAPQDDAFVDFRDDGGYGGVSEPPMGGGGAGGSPDAGTPTEPDPGGMGGVLATGGTAGGAGGVPVEPPPMPEPPMVDTPASVEGPWGAELVIEGTWLGSAERSNVFVVIDDGRTELAITPVDPAVLEWTETRIVLRVPFPSEGEVRVETPQGVATAGSFAPSWLRTEVAMAPAAALVASLSPAAGRITALVDTGVVLDVDVDGVIESPVELAGLAAGSGRLFVSDAGGVEGFGISDGAAPEIVALVESGGAYAQVATGVVLDATERATAGGVEGASVWMHRSDGWWHARPGPDWAVDAGPVADPNPSGKHHAAGATSDGSLFIGYAVDTGGTFDDMEAANLRQLLPGATVFEASFRGGRSTDDYLTSLALHGRGAGLVVHYCGSDVDPFGVTNQDYRCFSSAVTYDGAAALTVPNEGPRARLAFTPRVIAAAFCDADGTLHYTTAYGTDSGEAILWPCADVVALEIDPERNPIVIVSHGGAWHVLR